MVAVLTASPTRSIVRPHVGTASSRRYERRRPEKTPLYKVVAEHLEGWLETRAVAEQPVPAYVERELRSYLACGILCFGFGRARCTSCGQGFVVAFSCKGRGVCPSCNGRRMAQTAAHLVDHVIPPVPVRQWVISVPKRLRCFLADRPNAVAALTRIFIEEIERLLCTAAGPTRAGDRPSVARPRLGAVSFLHRFGSAINHHVHLHACATDGVFAPTGDGPLWRHLGPCKSRVKAYNTDGGWLTWSTDELVADMQRILDRGFDAVKMKLGLPDPREDYARVKAVRKAIGDKPKLMVDVNTVWDLKTAVTWGRRLEEFDIAWLEEPMHPFDVRAHGDLAQALDLPIAVGETVYTLHAFRDYVDCKGADILQADVTKLSGIEEWLDVAALGRAYGLTVIPHTNVQHNVHAQLAAATPNTPMIECCYESLFDIWENPIRVVDGFYTLPDAPGVGGKLTDAVLAKHRVA